MMPAAVLRKSAFYTPSQLPAAAVAASGLIILSLQVHVGAVAAPTQRRRLVGAAAVPQRSALVAILDKHIVSK